MISHQFGDQTAIRIGNCMTLSWIDFFPTLPTLQAPWRTTIIIPQAKREKTQLKEATKALDSQAQGGGEEEEEGDGCNDQRRIPSVAMPPRHHQW